MNIFSNKNNVITYTVNKAGIDNLCISVQNGEVVINAPWQTTNMQIQKVVEEKKDWILNKISEYEQTVHSKKECIRTKNVRVLGENYKLLIEYKFVKLPSLSFEGKQIKVVLPHTFKRMKNEEIVETIMNKMYEKLAEKELEIAMEKTRILVGLAPEDYSLERMKNPLTLAKCVENKIIFNPDIVMYSREIIDYIVLHEFCHLKYKNHTKSFYNMLKTYMPNYEEITKKLNGIAY